MCRIGVISLALAALSLCPLEAAAQIGEVNDLEQDARLHFELGQRHFQRGELDEAAQEFEEAYRLSHRAPLLYNLSVAHRDAGRDAEAADALRRYLAADPNAENRARLEVVLRNLEQRLGQQPSTPPPAHTEPDTSSSAAATSTPATHDEPAASQGGGVSAGPIALLAGGGAVLVGAVITGALALTSSSDLSAMCPNDACPESARGLASDVSTLSVTTDVLWPVGTVAAGVGLAWLIAELTAPASRSVDVSVAASPNGVLVGARGRF